MAITNFIMTAVAVAAVASLMRSDVRGSTAMLRRNVKQIRVWMEEAATEAKPGDGPTPKLPPPTNDKKPPTKDPSA